MRNDKHFMHRLLFLLIMLGLIGVICVSRLVQIQLLQGGDTLAYIGL